jgi:putative phage-type endonuclease
MRQLAAERVTGKLEESYKNECMDRGKQMEAEAVNLYEMLTTEKIQEVGVCYPDEKKICSCSPDRLVGEEGLLEIKCPISTTHVEYLLANKLPIEYVQQVQGQLYVTGRKWCDFMSYYPSIKPMIVRVLRSEIFINALAIEIEVFVKQLDEMTERIRQWKINSRSF